MGQHHRQRHHSAAAHIVAPILSSAVRHGDRRRQRRRPGLAQRQRQALARPCGGHPRQRTATPQPIGNRHPPQPYGNRSAPAAQTLQPLFKHLRATLPVGGREPQRLQRLLRRMLQRGARTAGQRHRRPGRQPVPRHGNTHPRQSHLHPTRAVPRRRRTHEVLHRQPLGLPP